MKRLIIIPLLFLFLTLGATDYYVATSANGGSDSNTGLTGSPWLTLSYACGQVASGSHTIHVGAGTFTETTQSVLAVGVSIVGEGETSIIISHVADTLILCVSGDGINGNQSISNIYFDGDSYTGGSAIAVYGRSNFIIHDCRFYDFAYDAVLLRGDTDWGTPDVYATGNNFYDNTIYDCSGYWSTYGCLEIGGQKDITISGNVITSIDRGVNLWGFCVKFDGGGYNMGVTIRDNILTCPAKNGSDWCFSIELFDSRGGMEIYNNICQGTIDLSSNALGETNDDGGYGFAVKIHDNTVTYPTGLSDYVVGIDLERTFDGGTYIYNNHVSNFAVGFGASNVDTGEELNDLYVYYNIFHNIGRGASTYAFGMLIGMSVTVMDNINIWNNVLQGRTTSSPTHGIRVNGADGNNIEISNNIAQDFLNGNCIYVTGTHDIISIENNLSYNCGSTSAIDVSTATLTNEVVQNNLIATDPLFKSTSTYRLSESSPCIDAGLEVGLEYDNYGHKITGTPDIGAMEYGRYIMKTASGVLR